jgi:hypothetical protein
LVEPMSQKETSSKINAIIRSILAESSSHPLKRPPPNSAIFDALSVAARLTGQLLQHGSMLRRPSRYGFQPLAAPVVLQVTTQDGHDNRNLLHFLSPPISVMYGGSTAGRAPVLQLPLFVSMAARRAMTEMGAHSPRW